MNMFSLKKAGRFLVLALSLFIPSLFSPAVFAVEAPNGTWRDTQGITVDAANRNADAIRRSQNRVR